MTDYCTYIFESELRAMCFQASQFPDSETGGDLYGTWTYGDRPIIFLATGPGPRASANATKFFQDNEYIMKNEEILFKNFGIQYLGDWHSHHMLGLQQPSNGDQRRINNLMIKSKRKNMLEIIITHVTTNVFGNYSKPLLERALAYQYDLKPCLQTNDCNIKLLKTSNSIVRQHISSNKIFSSINLMNISPEITMDNIQLFNEVQYRENNNAETNCFSDIISAIRSR